MKWEYKTEIRLKALLSHHITQGVLSDHYCHKIPIHALFIGSNMETAVKLMTSTGGVRHSCLRLIPVLTISTLSLTAMPVKFF